MNGGVPSESYGYALGIGIVYKNFESYKKCLKMSSQSLVNRKHRGRCQVRGRMGKVKRHCSRYEPRWQ